MQGAKRLSVSPLYYTEFSQLILSKGCLQVPKDGKQRVLAPCTEKADKSGFKLLICSSNLLHPSVSHWHKEKAWQHPFLPAALQNDEKFSGGMVKFTLALLANIQFQYHITKWMFAYSIFTFPHCFGVAHVSWKFILYSCEFWRKTKLIWKKQSSRNASMMVSFFSLSTDLSSKLLW